MTDEITLIIYNFLDMISLSLDRTIYGPVCGGTQTTIITWGGPIVHFRWDNIDDMDIKDLSVREIQPTQ